jgi:CubicO group peptidase (beta-lactamase class C family)
MAAPLLRRPKPGRSDADRKLPIETFIRRRMETGRIPGLAAGIVADGKLAWSHAAGWANIEHRRRVRTDTIFMLASISKTVTGTAVMRAVDLGHIELDEDINTYLPFAVRNPNHPGKPITTRMLLAHTSSLRDNWNNTIDSKDESTVPLGTFLRRCFTPGKALYDADKNFYKREPGAGYSYSNIGVTLAAYVAEVTTGVDFARWCRREIFVPLGMERTSWHLRDLPRAEVAMPYRPLPDGGFRPYGQYWYPDYPAGQLRTTVADLSKHLRMFMNDGILHGERILETITTEEMLQRQFGLKGQGLIWYWAQRHGVRYIGHSGGDPGVGTSLLFREDGVGAMVFTNGDWRGSALMDINWRLFDEIDA